MVDSDNFRAKQEAKELCDLGCTVNEKYGPYSGWKLSLRHDFDKIKSTGTLPRNAIIDEDSNPIIDNIIEHKTEYRFGITGTSKDNRTKQIEIIRKSTDSQYKSALSAEQQAKLKMFAS